MDSAVDIEKDVSVELRVKPQVLGPQGTSETIFHNYNSDQEEFASGSSSSQNALFTNFDFVGLFL